MVDPGDDLKERAEARYLESLRSHALADVRPRYRTLLKRLRGADPDAYEEAVRRYEEDLLSETASAEGDPVAAWIAYGMWLANRLEPGTPVAVDATGRAEEVDDDPPLGALLLHLPEDGRALVLAEPQEPTDHQSATRELLT